MFILILGQVWASTYSFCHWIVDMESELIELVHSEEGEAEKEDIKKEKEIRISWNSRVMNISSLIPSYQHQDVSFFLSLHHPEITTPPPERLFS